MKADIKIKPQKEYNISLLRFMAMVFIVLCHFFQYYDLELAWWFNVGVQIFFCVSGFLYGKKRITSPIEFICKNMKKILIPYFCFLIPSIILYYFFHREAITVLIIKRALLTRGVINGLGHLWFISYILFCYLITPYLQSLADKMKKLKWQAFLGIFVLFAIFGSVLSKEFGSVFVFSRIFCYLFGYFGAVFLQNYKNHIFKFLICVFSFITLIMNIIRIYLKYINPQTSELIDLFVEYSHAFLGISITFIFILFIKNIRRSAFLDLADKYSFYIYICHQLFILSPFTLLTITDYRIFNWTITIFSIVVLAIILKFVADVVEGIFMNIVKHIKRKICSSR